MDNQPLVSICVITYRSAEYVLETLESAYKQSYQNIELIVSDEERNVMKDLVAVITLVYVLELDDMLDTLGIREKLSLSDCLFLLVAHLLLSLETRGCAYPKQLRRSLAVIRYIVGLVGCDKETLTLLRLVCFLSDVDSDRAL